MSGLYITKFIDRLQQLELKGSRDFVCPLSDAKLLHSDITKLLLDIQNLQQATQSNNQPVEVQLNGGDF